MKAEVDVEVYAIAVGVEGETGVGSIRHELEIVTETDVIFLPITANILSWIGYLLQLLYDSVLSCLQGNSMWLLYVQPTVSQK